MSCSASMFCSSTERESLSSASCGVRGPRGRVGAAALVVVVLEVRREEREGGRRGVCGREWVGVVEVMVLSW